MKKQFLLIMLFYITDICVIKSQALPLFTASPFPQTQCNNLAENYSNQWKPSHGSPNVLNLGCGNNVVRLYSKNQSISERKSEGVFIDLNNIGITLNPLKKYKIIISYRYSFPNNLNNAINFDAYFVNNMTEKSSNSCDEEKEPSIADKVKILTFGTGELLSDTYPCQIKSVEKGQIVINKSYKYLWITSNLNKITPNLREYVDIEKVEMYLDGDNPNGGPVTGSGNVTMEASNLSIPCGSIEPIIFTSTTSSRPQNDEYSWLAMDGWNYNGVPVTGASISIFSSNYSSSIEFAPTDPYILPRWVNLHLRMNGSPYNKHVIVTRKGIDESNSLEIVQGPQASESIPPNIPFQINLSLGQSVLWSSSDNTVGEVQSISTASTNIIIKKQGYFRLSAVVSNLCGQSKTITKDIWTGNIPFNNNDAKGININIQKKYKIFPNPTSDIINITAIDEDIKMLAKTVSNAHAELFNFLGIRVGRINLKDNSGHLSLSGINQGIYILKIYFNDKVEEHQVIVK